MRLSKLILALALLATVLPGCASSDRDPSDDAVVDARTLTASDCDYAHREAIHHCQRLFHPGTCYDETAAAYDACLASVSAPAAE